MEFLKNRLPEGSKYFLSDVFTNQSGILYVKVKESCVRNDFLIKELDCGDQTANPLTCMLNSATSNRKFIDGIDSIKTMYIGGPGRDGTIIDL